MPESYRKMGNYAVYFDIDGLINRLVAEDVTSHEYSPVIQKTLGSNKNLVIRGKFRTDYDVSDQKHYEDCWSTIQVGKRHAGKVSAFDGFGIAWRPTIQETTTVATLLHDLAGGETDIRVSTGDTFSNSGVAFINDRSFIYASTSAGSGTRMTFKGCENVEYASEGANVFAAPSNIYLIDCAIRGDDIYFGEESIKTNGPLNYIAAGFRHIIPNTDYYFQLTIGDDYAATFKINEIDSFDDVTATISYGARTPIFEYLYRSGVTFDFGIGVLNTAGYEWKYDNIRIASFEDTYLNMYLEYDISTLGSPAYFKMSGYGRGKIDGSGSDSGYGIELYVMDASNDWIYLDDIRTRDTYKLYDDYVSPAIGDEYFIGGKVKLLLKTKYPQTAESVLGYQPSYIEADYMCLSDDGFAAYHLGNKIDTYISDERDLRRVQVDITIPNSKSYRIGSTSGFKLPVILIDSVELLSGGAPTGIILREGMDFVVKPTDPNYRYSIYEELTIMFRQYGGMGARIIYKTTDLIESLQELVNSELMKVTPVDNVVKYYNPVTVDVRLMSDCPRTDDLDKALREAILSASILEWTDILTMAYTYGATSVTSLDINIISHNNNGRVESKVLSTVGDIYQLSKIQRFVVKSTAIYYNNQTGVSRT